MKITTNGIELNYQKTGSGEPLLLLHGNGEDHKIFDKLSRKLKNNFTLYAIDSRDHGESQKTGVLGYDEMMEDIFGFMQQLGLKTVNLIGFSDGAIVGLMLAKKHPEKVKRMALLGVNLNPGDFTEESMDFMKAHYEKTKDPLFKLMMTQPQMSLDYVKDIKTPTLLVAAENDLFKRETFLALNEALPDSDLMIMQGQDHDSYITGSDLLYEDLLGFFCGVDECKL